jgi:glycosyltransferase involved in cell wall biosynthesis
MKNVVLTDFIPDKEWVFIRTLSESSGLKWDSLCCDYRRKSNLKRLLMYFVFPFSVFLHRKQYKNMIAWQQFYGLILAFYARLFRVKSTFNLFIMTFIYKEKAGFAGYIYSRFMHYIVTSRYITKIIVFSSKEVDYYSDLFPLAKSKFTYIPLGIEEIKDLAEDKILQQEQFILSTGKSNRDYDFLLDALGNTQYRIKIIANSVKQNSFDNVELYNNTFGRDMLYYMNNCFCVVITLKNTNISAGQLVILQAMQLGKPIIVTESAGISDYIIPDYNGIIVKKEKQSLINAIQQLYLDRELYVNLSRNGRIEYEKKYSMPEFGTSIGNCVACLKV